MMKPLKLIKIYGLLVLLLGIAACKETTTIKEQITHLPYYKEASFTPNWISHGDPALEQFHRVSPFSLTNQNGEEITAQTFDDKIYVTNFFFTSCPGICPKMTSNMSLLQEAFFEDPNVLLLSHSVTPARDSVPVLKAYAESKGIFSEKWHIVTGTQEEIYRLGRKEYFVEEDLGLTKAADEFLHTENFVLIDKHKYIRGIYNGLNKASIKQLIEDIKMLQKES